MKEPDLSWLYLAPVSRPKAGDGGPPPPPYHLQSAEILSVGVVFDQPTIERALPNKLKATPDRSGGFGLLTVGSGWGIAPYTASFAWIDVEDHDSSDGAKGRFHAGGYLSSPCFDAFCRYYRNGRIARGYAAINQDDRSVVGTTGRDEGVALRCAVRPNGVFGPSSSGVNYYLHADGDGALCINSAAYTVSARPCEVVELEIFAPPAAPFGRLSPERVLWSMHSTGSLTHSEPKSAKLAPGEFGDEQATRMIVLNILSQLGRAAFLVGAEGRLILANELARKHLGTGLRLVGGRLVAARRAEQPRFERILGAALSPGSKRLQMEVVALAAEEGDARIIAQALPVPSEFEAPAAVLLVNDPAKPSDANIADSLQLLGLTRAESRAASIVGMGLSQREAAEMIGISEGTIRVTLTQVYDKLGLSRASELASLVGRLSAMNAYHPIKP